MIGEWGIVPCEETEGRNLQDKQEVPQVSVFDTWCGFELFKIRCSILEDEEVMILKPTETIYGRLLNINVKDNYIIREWKSHSVCVLPGHRCVRQSSASEHRCSACTSHEPWHQPAEATTGNWERSGDVILTRASHRHDFRWLIIHHRWCFTCVSHRRWSLGGGTWSFQLLGGQNAPRVCRKQQIWFSDSSTTKTQWEHLLCSARPAWANVATCRSKVTHRHDNSFTPSQEWHQEHVWSHRHIISVSLSHVNVKRWNFILKSRAQTRLKKVIKWLFLFLCL